MEVVEAVVAQDLLQQPDIVGGRLDEAADAGVGPDDRRPGVLPDHLHEGVEMRRPLSLVRQDHVHVVVDQGQKPDFPRELEDPVECRITKAR